MDDRDHLIHSALLQFDPELAGLFERGCLVAEDIGRTGSTYLLAHAGRELSKSILQIVARELPADHVASSETETLSPGREQAIRLGVAELLGSTPDDPKIDKLVEGLGENHRSTIAKALGLHPAHPLVSAWFKLQKDLVATTHYRGDTGRPPAPDRVLASWTRLKSFLYARVAPYFSAQRDLDALLAIAKPSASDLRAVQELLVRPQLRLRFYQQISEPGWLRPLHSQGAFSHPPEWIPVGDGGFREVFWPEGNALVRIGAAHDPGLVVTVLQRLSPAIRNPRVWQTVGDAVLQLPPTYAARLVPVVAKALQRTEFRRYGDLLVDAVPRLAEAKEKKVFDLLSSLLSIRDLERLQGPEDTRPFRRQPERLLSVLEVYWLQRMMDASLPALIALNGWHLFKLLVGKLDQARKSTTKAEYDDERMSVFWCGTLDGSGREDDPRAILATAATKGAVVCARANQVDKVLKLLGDKSPLYTRMRIQILAALEDPPQLQVDRILRDPETHSPTYGAREIAGFLRAHFEKGTPSARALFVQRLEAGPPSEEIAATLEFQGEERDSAEGGRRVREHWQRRVLRWFHAELPPELGPVAKRINYTPEKPSLETQDLDEVGFHSGGAFWRGESSPASADELSAMTEEGVIEYLQQWQPDPNQFEGPSRQGLGETVRGMMETDASGREGLLRRIAQADGLHPEYLRAALAGVRKAANGDHEIPWAASVALARQVVLRAEEHSAQGNVDKAWTWARAEALELVQEGCGKDRIPIALRDEVLGIVDLAVEESGKWETPQSFSHGLSRAIHDMLNTDGGKAAHLFIATCLWVYRQEGNKASQDLHDRATRWAEAFRRKTDGGRPGVRACLGHFLPQLHVLIPDWVAAQAVDLFESGMREPALNPTWGAYLAGQAPRRTVFTAMRSWLGRHVLALPDVVAAESNTGKEIDRHWSLSRHFLAHVTRAFLFDFLRPCEEDRVLEQTYASVTGADKSNLYWEICRGWSGSESPTIEVVARLLWLWDWRLKELEAAGALADADEAEGLAWLIMTDHLAPEKTLGLTRRSLRLAPARRETRRMVWPCLLPYVALDPAATIEMAESLVHAELAGQWPYFAFEEVAPVFRGCLDKSSPPAVREQAVKLVHLLGDKGWNEFGSLLP